MVATDRLSRGEEITILTKHCLIKGRLVENSKDMLFCSQVPIPIKQTVKNASGNSIDSIDSNPRCQTTDFKKIGRENEVYSENICAEII